MKAVPVIYQHGNTSELFKEQAEALRELADEVETGNVLALKWVVIEKRADKVIWYSNHFKAKGMSAMELYGTMCLASAEYARDHLRNEESQ